ncbi:Smr/MutS family protein [Pelagibacterales bacterium SAG-MED31]|nr:Smr/MutS family protein [Pelagibacterales bacterium SAG-MED31]
MKNDNDLFLKKMKGVTPIKKTNRILGQKEKLTNKNKKNKTETKIKTSNIPLKTELSKNKKNSDLTMEKTNIRKNIKKKIFKIHKKIDFHGKSLLGAEEIFSSTIEDCFYKNKRCLLFVTGKGVFKSKDNHITDSPQLYHSVIRSAFLNWVEDKQFSKYILSFEQALIEHGGDGAFYVYLRKNKN